MELGGIDPMSDVELIGQFEQTNITHLSTMAPSARSFCTASIQEWTIALFTHMYSGVLPKKSGRLTSAPVV